MKSVWTAAGYEVKQAGESGPAVMVDPDGTIRGFGSPGEAIGQAQKQIAGRLYARLVQGETLSWAELEPLGEDVWQQMHRLAAASGRDIEAADEGARL